MKNNVLSFLSLAFLFSVIACSNPEAESIADATGEDVTIEITSRSLESENSAEDMNFLLVRKWVNENSNIFLDLKIDSSFEGKTNGEDVVFGTWEIAKDQKTLFLKGNVSDEGKGSGFNATYSIVEMSFESMIVTDEEGNELSFTASE